MLHERWVQFHFTVLSIFVFLLTFEKIQLLEKYANNVHVQNRPHRNGAQHLRLVVVLFRGQLILRLGE